jgi:hypothetical protein
MKLNSRSRVSSILAVLVVVLMAFPWVALADTLTVNVVVVGGGTVVAPGGSVTLSAYLSPDNENTSDVNGCNATGSDPVSVTLTLFGTSHAITLQGCGSSTAQSATFQVPSGTAPGSYPVTTSVSGGKSGGVITGGSATVTVANLDTTPPSAGASASPAATAAGWNSAPVTVSLTATDASGVASINWSLSGATTATGSAAGGSASVLVENDGVTTVTYSATDTYNNTSAAQTITVRIDKQDPAITGTANHAGWTNQDVVVTFDCQDQLGLSGIASCPTPVTVSTEGDNQEVSGSATDNAGNSASTSVTGIKIDKTAPTITGAPDRAPDENGWYNAPVTFTFTCDDSLSGVAACSGSQVLNEGGNQSVSGTAADHAGNTASFSVSGINVDETAPTVTHTPVNGWYNHDVTLTFACEDQVGLSGVASCTPAADYTAEGWYDVEGAAVDNAGNTTADTAHFGIDKTKPTFTLPGSGDHSYNTLGGYVLHYTFDPSDSLSGLADQGCTGPVSGTVLTLGQSATVTCHATDLAGNTETQSFTVNVTAKYPWSGILLPSGKTVKLGSTVPVRAQLTGDSAVITDMSITIAVFKVTNNVASETPATLVSSSAADSGNTLRYDPSGNQYIFNLGTKGLSEGTYRIVLTMPDGTLSAGDIVIKK